MTALIGGSVLLIATSAIALAFGWGTADEQLIWTSIAASACAGVLLAIAAYRSRSARTASGAVAVSPERDVSTESNVRPIPASTGTVEADGATAATAATAAPGTAPETGVAAKATPEPERRPTRKPTRPRTKSGPPEPIDAASGPDGAAVRASDTVSASDRARDLSRDIAEVTERRARPRAETKPAAASASAAASAGAGTAARSTRKSTAAKTTGTRAQGASGATRADTQVVVLPDRGRFHRPECRFASDAEATRMSKTPARRRGYEPCGDCKP